MKVIDLLLKTSGGLLVGSTYFVNFTLALTGFILYSATLFLMKN